MILLIDGYNVLKRMYSTNNLVTQKEKHRFIKLLSTYLHHKSHTAIIVFDGVEDEHQAVPSIKIIYSGPQASADDVIKNMCEQISRHDSVLISSDRQLCAHAYSYHIPSMDADAFLQIFGANLPPTMTRQEKNVTHPALKRKMHESTPLVDKLMQEASAHVPLKLEEDTEQKKRPSCKLSKKDKALQQLLEKL